MQKKWFSMNKKSKFFTLAIVFLLFMGTVFFAFSNFSLTSYSKRVNSGVSAGQNVKIEIPINSSTATIANLLKQQELIDYPSLFRVLSKFYEYDGKYKSGTFMIKQDTTVNNPSKLFSRYINIMKVLSSNPSTTKVTIPEGYTYKQIKEVLKKAALIDDSQLDVDANSNDFTFSFLKEIPKRTVRLEGYLFPDTYLFEEEVSEKEIIKTMLGNFESKLKPQYQDQIDALNKKYEKYKLKMDLDKIIILASIIEREAKNSDERARIAGVFYNRIMGRYNAPRRLESCATIQYLYQNIETKGITEENLKRIQKGIILNVDTAISNPYNTYKYEGLPPGPICNPGIASIEAALQPEDHQYLYFVAKNDASGKHVFSKTLAEHDRASRANTIN